MSKATKTGMKVSQMMGTSIGINHKTATNNLTSGIPHGDCLINRGTASARRPSDDPSLAGTHKKFCLSGLEDDLVKGIRTHNINREDMLERMVEVLCPEWEGPVWFFWESTKTFEFRTQHMVGFLLGPCGTYHYPTIDGYDYRIFRWVQPNGDVVTEFRMMQNVTDNCGQSSKFTFEQSPWYRRKEVRNFLNWPKIHWVLKVLREAWQEAQAQSLWDRRLLILDLFRFLKIIIGFGNFLKGSTERINRSEATDLDRYLREACELLDDEEHHFDNLWIKSEIMGGR